MLSQEQQREILALGLLALALFLLLALVPPSWLAPLGEGLFPSGNLMGEVGGGLRAVLYLALGVASVLLPLLVGVTGLWQAGWLSTARTVRSALLGGGLLLFVPPALHVLAEGSPVAGVYGGWLGDHLQAGLGTFGSLFFLAALLLLLLVATVGSGPLRVFGRGLVWAGGVLARGLRALSRGFGRLRKWWADEMAKRREGGTDSTLSAEASDTFSFAEEESEPPAGTVRAAAGKTGPALGEPAAGSSRRAGSSGAGAGPGSIEEPDSVEPAAELPPLEQLNEPDRSDRADMERELDRLGTILVEKLRTFNVECSIAGRTTGPVVTQFEVEPAPGVKVSRIASLEADLALAMKARSIRIVAPIPGKAAVGVEIPNPRDEIVYLREILESPEFSRSRAELPLALGRDLTGRPYVADLAQMPHALIAGATGSGKSVCLNAFITSLVYRHTPETLRFLLIDPKMVELSAYVDLPHLRHPVVTDPAEAAGVLKWAVYEMERRYELLHLNGVRSIGEFNRKLRQGVTLRRTDPKGPEGDPDRWIWRDGPVPYVVLVVDELADLMMTVQSEVEKPLTLLAQKARAIGIHLLVATQRPSVNVITGLIKANFPARVAFRVASKVDSRTIIDQNGADALLGNGDMLFLPPGTSEPIRIQGAYISTEETERLIQWYRAQAAGRAEKGKPEDRWPAEDDILEMVRSFEAEAALEEGTGGPGEERDERFWEAAEICIQHNQGSTSLLQRRMKIGYGRAARIVDQLHEAHVLGPPDGSKAREVLMTMAELEFLRREEESG